ncbi:MAG: ATP-binding cassette domain-containing protein, partial [Lachnospiraceae bacterium]|nr:ATP-binding cassette domain-containing protein [Lachnospiraceae bacterium]
MKKTNDRTKIKTPVTKGIAKVPVIMQMEALECGAACLAMVLAYYDKWIPLEQVRFDCGVSRDGSNAKNVLIAARNYGLSASGYRLDDVNAIRENCVFPAIIHWEFNHFVVLKGIKGDKAYINDPGRGSVVIPLSELDNSFTGICLMFEPSEGFERSGKKKSVLGFAKSRLKGTGVAVAFVVLTTIITSLFGVIEPVFSRIFLDRLLTKTNPDWNNGFIILLALFSILQIIISWVQTIYSLKIDGKLSIIGNASYMWKVLHLPMDFYSQRMVGDIQLRKDENASIAQTLVQTLTPLFLQTGMMFFYLFVLIRYSVLLTAIGLFSILIDILMAKIISGKRVNLTRVQMRDSGKLSGLTVSGIEMIESIKAGGAENGFFARWSGFQASVNTSKNKFVKLNSYLGLIPLIISELTNTLILIIGIGLTMRGEFTLGMVMAFDGLLVSFTGPAGQLISAGQMIQEMRTNMERVEDVMLYPSDKNVIDRKVDTGGYKKLNGEIELKNITFGYSRLGKPVIKDFNMSIKPGSRVAFVGSSGCGKSTLAKLISGLYDP